MVGHILGLGDRHPSNLMLDRRTGKVLHIDFGDCFEVAMHRDKFPERVPFRLTRMLVHAMEVSGVEGTYRLTCERVMRVLRDNRDSLLSMLEAFIHDPLISWRLLGAQEPGDERPSRRVGSRPSSRPVLDESDHDEDEDEDDYDSYDSDETDDDDDDDEFAATGNFAKPKPGDPTDEYDVIVCHANVIRFLFLRALQLPPETWLRLCTMNCSITYLTISPSGHVAARLMGDVGHLKPDQITFGEHKGFNW